MIFLKLKFCEVSKHISVESLAGKEFTEKRKEY